MISALKMAYVVFPTLHSARTIFRVTLSLIISVMQMINGTINLNGKDKIEVTYSPSCSRTDKHEVAERFGGQAALFGSGQSFYDPDTKSYISGNQETIVHEDWICEFVNLSIISLSVKGKISQEESSAISVKRLKLLEQRLFLQ